MIVVESVAFTRGRRIIVPEMSLTLRTGELTVVAGPNGAGKSTMLRLLTGDLKPSTGRIRFDGIDIAAWHPRDLARRRAVLSQSSQLAFPFTVREVVEMGLADGRAARSGRLVADALARLGLSEFGNRHMQELSGGEQQRVHLARVLCQLAGGDSTATQYVFLDEPTSSLDIRHQVQVLETVRAMISPKLGALVILHDLNLASAYADRFILLENGTAVADGHPSLVLTESILRMVYDLDLAVSTVAGRMTILPAVRKAASRGYDTAGCNDVLREGEDRFLSSPSD